ncbi:unnamed protein product [Bursaphelenchus okinawaensis]|uniref:Galactosylgalactosylxylosylprotein 3-beta-glucuronosyltransferase n=1 Tax=Bursaphelenchus okinawaensis TaxID=465554 RepID=A0A811L8V7_9BILA|nr:unnamed protein product [Bursaphelenchus okinawaensis]CAG9119274.1 unnamed protein product [Bursaphelenchus okinawaensis]
MKQSIIPYYTTPSSSTCSQRSTTNTAFFDNIQSFLYRHGISRNKQKLMLLIVVLIWIVSFMMLVTLPSEPRQIIIITPVMQRPERIADLTMLSQTLIQLKNIHWLLIEDDDKPHPIVPWFLSKYNIPYTYLYTTNLGLPCRGWAQRNLAMDYMRQNRDKFEEDAVVYFADDDNSYDLRLFDMYIRKVDYMGVWAVGLPGNALVEHPLVSNGRLVGWHTAFRPERNFATDMAGFALNIDVLTKANASFNLKCTGTTPEDCLLTQMKINKARVTPFGWEGEKKEILVWHRKTAPAPEDPFPNNGYIVENRKPPNPICERYREISKMSYPQALLVAKLYNTTQSARPRVLG